MNKLAYADFTGEKEELLVQKLEASPLPDLLRLVFSEEEREIYQLYRAGMSLAKIGQALGQDRLQIYKKLCIIKSNIRFLLKVKKVIKILPRLIKDFCPPECPFRE
jgi:hypothetical protein